MQLRFKEAKKPCPNYPAISGRLGVQAAQSTVYCLSAPMYSEAVWLNYKAANISSALVRDQMFLQDAQCVVWGVLKSWSQSSQFSGNFKIQIF